jgi:pimeloyl-ACP methyl ester carboxylesterase
MLTSRIDPSRAIRSGSFAPRRPGCSRQCGQPPGTLSASLPGGHAGARRFVRAVVAAASRQRPAVRRPPSGHNRRRRATARGRRRDWSAAGADPRGLMSLETWALPWQPLLAASHRLIAYDLRGHGRSTLGRSGFGVQAYAQDLAAVLEHFDVRRGVVVVVHSTGGIGALALAITRPADAVPAWRAGADLHRAAGAGRQPAEPAAGPDRALRAGAPGLAPPTAEHAVHPHAVRYSPRPGPGGVRAPHHGVGAAPDDHRRGEGGVAVRLS